MKVLTVKQPWAYLICAGIKPIENRTWKTNRRERILIHAAAKSSNEPYMLFNDEQASEIDDVIMDVCASYKQTSAIIGSVEIVDCVMNHPSIWAEKTVYKCDRCSARNRLDMCMDFNCENYPKVKPIYNWVLANPILFKKPIENVKGKLSFWDFKFDYDEQEYRFASLDQELRHSNHFPCFCEKCNWVGSSEFVDGGGEIADTGDYSDIYCPICGNVLI